nr:venom protein [Lampona murina]
MKLLIFTISLLLANVYTCFCETDEVPTVDEIDLIDVVNTLQNKLNASGHSLDIALPQIVVIGCQSAGKSSVLERFVGKEFLPRGSRLVTRRPIFVQLIPSSEEYGVFLHNEEKKFTDFDEIRQEIIRATDEECGPQQFSRNPISLKIYSPRVLKLTVVDLPGIIRVPVGDQADDTVQQVRDIVLEYIRDEKTIILAVTPTSQDIANSDALELAKIVDPNRERTIGVLTKLDVEGVDARDILDNTHLTLKKGWVGVVNRNNKEIEEKKDMDYIENKEKNFFRNSELYSHMAHRMGIQNLQKLLQKTLRSHIKQSLPAVRTEIAAKLSKFEKELKEYESFLGDGPNAKQLYMVKLIQRFADDINTKIMGYSEVVPTNTLTYGAIINFKLHTEVQGIISQVLLPNEEEITRLIPNINGMRNSISIPSLAVDSVCRTLIERFKEPLDTAVTCIKDTLLKAIEDSATMLDNYPSLKHEVTYQISQWVERECENTKDRLKSHIDAEMFYINTGHPGFDSSTCDPVAPPAGPVKVWRNYDTKKTCEDDEVNTFLKLLAASEEMQKQVQYVTAIVIKYLEIVQVQVSDITTKYISFFLVKKILTAIRTELVPTVIDAASNSSVSEDWDDDVRRKEEIQNMCTVLREALEAIKSF